MRKLRGLDHTSLELPVSAQELAAEIEVSKLTLTVADR